jgi:hypothetical protein
MNVRLRLAHGRKKVSASGALPTESSDSVLTDSPCSDTAPPTQTADLPGVVGWSWLALVYWLVLASSQGQQVSTEKRQATEELTHSFQNKRQCLRLQVIQFRGIHQRQLGTTLFIAGKVIIRIQSLSRVY